MIRQRGPFSAAPSKATPQTLCQKCLKRGHYSYECKSSAQERPYASRPSRTQQLANPEFLPKLTSDVPNDLLRKKGIADEELAKKEAERGRKRKLEDDGSSNASRKRSRSVSSYSSVSTISTNRSRSVSLDPAGRGLTGQSQLMSGLDLAGKRLRSRSSRMSYTSDREGAKVKNDSRYQKSRRSSSGSSDRRNPRARQDRNGNRRRSPYNKTTTRSLSCSPDSSHDARRRKRSPVKDGGAKRRRRASKSPDDRGRERDFDGPRRSSRRIYSPSESRDKSEVTRHRKSMTPGYLSKPDGASKGETSYRRRASYEDDHDRYGGSSRYRDESFHKRKRENAHGPKRKERSLSPFSKRLALTQAMNMGE